MEAEKLTGFENKKNEANSIFKKGDLNNARAAFQSLMSEIEIALKAPQTDFEYYAKLKTLYVQVTSNKALADFKLNNIDDCLTSCEKVLKVDPIHEKCTYRRALCFLAKGDTAASSNDFKAQLEFYTKAKSDLETGLKMDKNNKEVETRLTNAVRVIVQLQARFKDDPSNTKEKTKADTKKRLVVAEEDSSVSAEQQKVNEVKKIRLPVGLSKEKLDAITNSAVSQITENLMSSSELPLTASTFELNCYSFKKNVEKLYFYIKRIPIEHYKKLYQNSELSPDLLLLFVKSMKESGLNDDPAFCIELLIGLCDTNKFYLLVKQLAKSEKKLIREIIDSAVPKIGAEDKDQKRSFLLEKYACGDN